MSGRATDWVIPVRSIDRQGTNFHELNFDQLRYRSILRESARASSVPQSVETKVGHGYGVGTKDVDGVERP